MDSYKELIAAYELYARLLEIYVNVENISGPGDNYYEDQLCKIPLVNSLDGLQLGDVLDDLKFENKNFLDTCPGDISVEERQLLAEAIILANKDIDELRAAIPGMRAYLEGELGDLQEEFLIASRQVCNRSGRQIVNAADSFREALENEARKLRAKHGSSGKKLPGPKKLHGNSNSKDQWISKMEDMKILLKHFEEKGASILTNDDLKKYKANARNWFVRSWGSTNWIARLEPDEREAIVELRLKLSQHLGFKI